MSETVQVAIVTAITTIVPVAIAAWVAIRQQTTHNKEQKKELLEVKHLVNGISLAQDGDYAVSQRTIATLEPTPERIAAAEEAEKKFAEHKARVKADADAREEAAKKEQL